MAAYYNEIEPYAAAWLRNLIAAGHIPAGDVDTRSIVDVHPVDLIGYTQCHFFAGIGGWAYAARLAGWPDDRELWTGSAPCQPFSVAGKQLGTDDDRHLWPHYFRLIRACRPAVVMGEQVAAAVGKNWLDGVLADLEGIDYACGAAVVPACAVNAPHRRDRLWFVADAVRAGLPERQGDSGMVAAEDGEPKRQAAANDCERRSGSDVADAGGGRCSEPRSGQVEQPRRAEAVGGSEAGDVADADQPCVGEERQQRSGQFCGTGSNPWSRHSWITGHDGKARRVEPSIRLLAHGVPARVGRLRAYGNAIVPQVAAEVIGAYMECAP